MWSTKSFDNSRLNNSDQNERIGSPLKTQSSRSAIIISLKKQINMNSEDIDTQNNSGSGRWTTEEQHLYEQYVKANPEYFTKQASKGLRAFKHMA